MVHETSEEDHVTKVSHSNDIHGDKMSREEKLRVAKERLKQFQSQRRQQQDESQHQPALLPAPPHVDQVQVEAPRSESEPPQDSIINYAKSDVLTSENDMAEVKLEAKESLSRESLPKESLLKEQHLQESIELLIGEKNELLARLEEAKGIEAQLKEKLLSSQSSLEALEQQAADHKSSLLSVESEFRDRLESLKREHDVALEEGRLESDELRRKLEIREKETSKGKEMLLTTQKRLEMAEVNLTQLRSALAARDESQEGVKVDAELEELRGENERLKQRENELSNYIHQAALDREQIIHQYTAYSQQLAEQMENVSHQLVAKVAECDRLESREAELVAHVSAMETQLQRVRNNENQPVNIDEKESLSKHLSKESLSKDSHDTEELRLLRERVAQLDAKVKEIVAERDELQTQNIESQSLLRERADHIQRAEAQIMQLEMRIEMLESQASSSSDQASMMASNESDRIAASRAVSQNTELKQHQQQLEAALIELSNAKADLVDRVYSLQRRNAKLEELQNRHFIDLQGLHEAIRERERNIIALKEELRAIKSDLKANRKIGVVEQSDNQGSNAVETENEAMITSRSDTNSQKSIIEELLEAKALIRNLEADNCDLRSQLNEMTLNSRGNSITSNSPDSSSNNESREESTENEQSIKGNDGGKIEVRSEEKKDSVPTLASASAFALLEARFNSAMQKIADLSNEKERLEHQNVQLQEETDLVGEYITMYQYQRQKIKTKMADKEEQLRLASIEREQLKMKLEQLQKLVASFVKSQRNQGHDHIGYVDELATEALEEDTKKNENDYAKLEQGNNESEVIEEHQKKRADEIMLLLNEIGANQMLQDRFHPWFWAQDVGKLMTV